MPELTEEAAKRYSGNMGTVHATLCSAAKIRLRANTTHDVRLAVFEARNVLYNMGYTEYVLLLDDTNYRRNKNAGHERFVQGTKQKITNKCSRNANRRTKRR